MLWIDDSYSSDCVRMAVVPHSAATNDKLGDNQKPTEWSHCTGKADSPIECRLFVYWVLGAEEVLRIAKSEMHLFKKSPCKCTFLFQVHTGLFFEVNPLYESILKICDGLTDQEVVSELANEFSGEDVLKAIEVLAEAQLIFDASLKLLSDTHGPNQDICGLPESEPGESQF